MAIRSFTRLALVTAVGSLWLTSTPRPAPAAEAQPVTISFQVYKLEEENVEGPNVVRSYFVVGDKWMIFGVPKGCHLASGDEFVLTPTDPGLDGEIHVRRSPFSPESNLADDLASYKEAFSRQIPAGAQDTKVEPVVMDPYPFNGWQSLGFVCTYTFYGRSLRRTVGYINLDASVQVTVTTESSPASADKIEKMAHNFIGSWWTKQPVVGK